MDGRKMTREPGTCSKCLQPLDGSHKSYCKACFAQYMQAHYASDPEKFRAQEKARRDANPEYYREKSRRAWAREPEKSRAAAKAWRKANPESRKTTRRKGHLRSNYGISIADFEAMMYEQGNCCLICGNEMTVGTRGGRTAHVDHCHTTGEVRNLLCSRCNNGLGCFDDNPDLMVAAAAYIMRWNDRLGVAEIVQHSSEEE